MRDHKGWDRARRSDLHPIYLRFSSGTIRAQVVSPSFSPSHTFSRLSLGRHRSFGRFLLSLLTPSQSPGYPKSGPRPRSSGLAPRRLPDTLKSKFEDLSLSDFYRKAPTEPCWYPLHPFARLHHTLDIQASTRVTQTTPIPTPNAWAPGTLESHPGL